VAARPWGQAKWDSPPRGRARRDPFPKGWASRTLPSRGQANSWSSPLTVRSILVVGDRCPPSLGTLRLVPDMNDLLVVLTLVNIHSWVDQDFLGVLYNRKVIEVLH
jgi:hypothetical protein